MGMPRITTYSIFSMLLVFLTVLVFAHILHVFSNTKVALKTVSFSESQRRLLHADGVSLVMSDLPTNLFWFVQITDIHLSIHDGPSRTMDFKRFCSESIHVIRPEAVLVSGDLTDSKTPNKQSSRQYREEWTIYDQILKETGVLNNTRWLDIRGNHDVFNVPEPLHEENHFGKYGVQGPHHSQSYSFVLRKPFGNYSFIGMDACPSPGLKRPLNFFGILDSDNQQLVRQFATQAAKSNQTFWFGHYPTSTIVTPNFDLRNLIGTYGFAYLCGHLHTFLGWIPKMYNMQPEGFLELELGDWRENRYYRVVAVDHDLVSFTDVQMLGPNGEWPIILITNPKNARFLVPHKEPAFRIANSTHIRILVWSKWPISLVSVSIDGTLLGNAVPAVPVTNQQGDTHSSPLFVLPWTASHWATGSMHTITVHARDTNGNERIVTQPFNVDSKPLWEYDLLPTFFLRSNHTWNMCLCFYWSWFVLVASLLLPRILPPSFSRSIRFRSSLVNGVFRLSVNDGIFYPLMIYLLYEITCPIFMGFLLENHFGVVFSFGIFVANSFIRESLTYFYEIIQIFLFTTLVLLPAALYAGTPSLMKPRNSSSPFSKHKSYKQNLIKKSDSSPTEQNSGINPISVVLLLFSVLFTCVQCLFMLWYIGLPYGLHAMLLSPGRLAPIALSWLLTFRCPKVLST